MDDHRYDNIEEPTERYSAAPNPGVREDAWDGGSATVYLDYRAQDDQRAAAEAHYDHPPEAIPVDNQRQKIDPLSRGIIYLDEQGQFRLEKQLSYGGFSWVYLGRQVTEAFEKQIVLKVLEPRGTDSDFKAEAATLAQLGNHVHIIDIYDGRTTQGYDQDGYGYRYQWLAMPYASGGSLEQWAKQYQDQGSTFPVKGLVPVTEQIASALDYAHHNGRIHRDIKPANILFDQNGQVLLSDFGIAMDVSSSGRTMAFASAGTPPYMSPEQATGSDRLDERTDIYSLGVTMYRLLTGEFPYQGDNPVALQNQIVNAPVPSARQHNKQVSRDVDRVIQKAMAKNPEDRYGSAGELAQAFSKAVQAPGRRILAIGGVILALLIAAVFIGVVRANSISTDKAEAVAGATATAEAVLVNQTIAAVTAIAGTESAAVVATNEVREMEVAQERATSTAVAIAQQTAAQETADALANATATTLQITREAEAAAVAATATWQALPRPIVGTHAFVGKEGESVVSFDHEGSWLCSVGRHRRVDSVEVESSGAMIVNTSEWMTYEWDRSRANSNPCLYTHDAVRDNTTVFLQPERSSEKIYPDRVEGAAAETYQAEAGITYTSAFHFPVPPPGHQVFDLHVSDEDYAIRGLDLSN